MRNLHLILLQEFGIEGRHLFRERERLQLRSSDYKNYRIFSLRCLHKDLIRVSIKLKSTLDTSKARQIIRKAEKDLLQAKIKAINNILVQVDRQIEECRAKLPSIIYTERLGECQNFINKVSELRFNKVRQRQINKLNHLVSKKEGNITIANAANNITNSVNRQAQAPHNPTPAIALLPPREGSNSHPATVHPSLEGNSSPNNQASGGLPTPAIAHLPPGEGSNSLPGAVHLPLEDVSSSTAIVFLPSWEENNSSQATSLPLHRERNSSLNPLGHPRQGKVITPPGQAGKVIGAPQAQAYTAFPGGQCNLLGRQPYLHTPTRPQPRFLK